MSKHEKLLYAEIGALMAASIVTAVALGFAQQELALHKCGSTMFKLVPYIANHFGEVCSNRRLMYVITSYYVTSIIIIFLFGYAYVRCRKGIYIFNKAAILFVAAAFAVYVSMWVIGHDGTYRLDFSFHDGIGIMFFAAPVITACVQFLIMVVMLPEKRE